MGRRNSVGCSMPMNSHAHHGQESECRSIASDSKAKDAGVSHTFLAVDHRRSAMVQRRLQDMAGNSTVVKRLEAMQARADSRLPPPVQQKINPFCPPIQFMEVEDLQPGMFNMIGEIHADYSAENARSYDAMKIKGKMGSGTHYYPEDLLKVDTSHMDYADPVHLRLQQVIAFIQDDFLKLMPELERGISLDFSAALSQAAEKVQGASTYVATFGPKIVSEEHSVESIFGEIKALNLPVKLLETLAEDETWNFEEAFDPSDEYGEKFSDITEMILKEYGRRFMEESHSKTESHEGIGLEMFAVHPSIVEAQGILKQVTDFIEKFQNRLPSTLKLYFDLREKGHYSGVGHFPFSMEHIAGTIKAWDALGKMFEPLLKLRLSPDASMMHEAFIQIMSAVVTLVEALKNGMGPEKLIHTEALELRSMEMHRAAEALKGAPIAWKVGNKHIEDIRRFESEGKITTSYAYIDREKFNPQYYNRDELNLYLASLKLPDADPEKADKDIGDAFLAARSQQGEILKSVSTRI
jgi:hypothetical protein